MILPMLEHFFTFLDITLYFLWPNKNYENTSVSIQGALYLQIWPRKSFLTSGRYSVWKKNKEKRLQQQMVRSCSTWPPESNFSLKIEDSTSNESPNLFLQEEHTHYWVQIPIWRRISTCRSIHAAKVCSWPNRNVTPNKAPSAQFESVNHGW